MRGYAFLLMLLLACVTLNAQYRPATAEEMEFSRNSLLFFKGVFADAAARLNMNWKFRFWQEERGQLNGADEVDGSVASWIPHEVRGDYELFHEPGTPESDALEERVAAYYTRMDSLSAAGNTNAAVQADNPEFDGSIFVQVVVNNALLSQYQAEGTYADTTLTADETRLTVAGTVQAVSRVFPGSTNPPQTILLFGEVHFKGDTAAASYGRNKPFSRASVKHLGIFISSGRALAKQFIAQLNLRSIADYVKSH